MTCPIFGSSRFRARIRAFGQVSGFPEMTNTCEGIGWLHARSNRAILASMTERKRKATEAQRASGTKDKVIADLVKYAENPDEPMVPDAIASALATTRNMNIAPSKMYDDNGHRLNAIRYIAARVPQVSPPRTPEGVFCALESYFTFCGENGVPVTLGAFALWCGVTQAMISKIERDTRDPERAEAFSKAKECIRTFLETLAYEGTLNPIIWFHTHKTVFGAVENQQVTVRVEDNTHELTQDERNERRALLLKENDDGSFGPEVIDD